MSNATETTPQRIKVTAMIGFGEKRHRAWAIRDDIDPGTPWARRRYRYLTFACCCPGTRNGFACVRASVVAEGWELANCEN